MRAASAVADAGGCELRGVPVEYAGEVGLDREAASVAARGCPVEDRGADLRIVDFCSPLCQSLRTRMNNHRDAGLTRVEILVGLAVFGVVLFVILPALFDMAVSGHDGTGMKFLGYIKYLHTGAQQMALDGETTGDRNLGWPGDTGGTFTNWQRHMVPAYVGTNDFCRASSAPGRIVPVSKFPLQTMSEGALIVYAVSSNSPPETVLFSSANFTNSPSGGAPLLKSAKPWGKRKFVVLRKGGDGAVLVGSRVGKTNEIGGYAPPVK